MTSSLGYDSNFYDIYAPDEKAIAELRKSNSRWSKIFNSKTKDFLIGAGVSGSLSMATRYGVIGGAAALGVSALPAALAAAAATGVVMGTYRFGKEYYKDLQIERKGGMPAHDFFSAHTGKQFAKHLLTSTALSTVGGSFGYAFTHYFGEHIANFVMDKGGVVIEKAKELGLGEKAAAVFAQVKQIDLGAKAAALVQSVKDLNLEEKAVAAFTSAKSTVGGWFNKVAAFVSPAKEVAPAPVAKVVEVQRTVVETKTSRLPQIIKSEVNVTLPAFTQMSPLMSEDILKTIPKEVAIVTDIKINVPLPEALPPVTSEDIAKTMGDSVKDQNITIVEKTIPTDKTATGAIDTAVVEAKPETNILLPEAHPPSVEDEIKTYFEDQKLSSSERKLVQRAIEGHAQSQKDIFMKMHNEIGNFKSDPTFELKVLNNSAELGCDQAKIDRAYMKYHGDGMPADPKAAIAEMKELSKYKAARNLVGEWLGTKVTAPAKAATRAVSEKVQEAVQEKIVTPSTKGLGCVFKYSADGNPISAICKAGKGVLENFKIGDKIAVPVNRL